MMSKQLGDFLQEQQEPFILQVYLLERGYNTSNVDTCLEKSVCSGLKRNRKLIPNCSKIVRALYKKFVSVTNSQKISNDSGIRDKNACVSETDSSRQQIADEDKFSSASSATIFNSCSESDGEEVHYSSRNHDRLLATAVYHLATTAKNKHILAENENQLGPVSVLEGIKSGDHSQLYKKHDDGRRIQKHLFTSLVYKSAKPFSAKPDVSSQYGKNKKVVQQTRQLLFDCVREVVEKHKRDSPNRQIPLGPEKLWQLISQNIWLWSKDSINETNTNNLLHLDMLASAKKWNSFEHQMHEIGMQIADSILEDISNEVIS